MIDDPCEGVVCAPGSSCDGGACVEDGCSGGAVCPDGGCPLLQDSCGNPKQCACGAGSECLADETCCAPQCDGLACRATRCDGKVRCTESCGSWLLLRPEGENITPRLGAAMAYRESTGALVVMGGQCDSGDLPCSDTWELAATTTPLPGQAPAVAWTRISEQGPARDGAELIAAFGELLLYGGCAPVAEDPESAACVELQRYTGSGWEPFETTGDGPGPRADFSAAFDRRRQELLIFAGRSGASGWAPAELVILDASRTWRRESGSPPGATPSAEAMAFDEVTGELHLYFGEPTPAHWRRAEGPDGTMAWVADPDLGPGPRHGSRMVWEPGETAGTGRLVLFGGRLNQSEAGCGTADLGDSWELAGGGGTFTPAADWGCGGVPAARNHHSLAAAPSFGGVVLFGGAPGSSTTGAAHLLLRGP